MTGRQISWILLPLLALALVFQLRHSEHLIRVSRYLAIVDARTSQASRAGRLPRMVAQQNLEMMRRAAELAPAEVLVPVFRGNQYLLTGRPQAAMRAYHDALKLEPRGEVYGNLGKAALAADDEEIAFDHFRTALRLDHTLEKELRLFLPELATAADE